MPMGINLARTLGYVVGGQARAEGQDRYDDSCADHACDFIRRWREAQGWTQERLAEAIGRATEVGIPLTQSALSKIEKRQNQPRLRTLIGFSRVSGHSLDEILGLRAADDRITRILEELERMRADLVARLSQTPDPPSVTVVQEKGKKR